MQPLIFSLMVKITLILGMAGMAMGAGSVYQEIKIFRQNHYRLTQPVASPSTFNVIFSPTPTVKPKPKDKTEIPPTNPDESNPLVNCKIHEKCGGGSIQLTEDQCAQTICCGFDDGRWKFYYSKSQCETDARAFRKEMDRKANEEYIEWAKGIHPAETTFGSIVNDFKNKADKIVQETNDYQLNLPNPPDYDQYLDKLKQNTQIVIPSPSPSPELRGIFY